MNQLRFCKVCGNSCFGFRCRKCYCLHSGRGNRKGKRINGKWKKGGEK